eukprot:492426_1
MSKLPRWVMFDRQVLRFYAYFKEPVFDSNVESSRLRKCIFYFYLEDESIFIGEVKQENSGIPQGIFLKRHRIPKSTTEYLGLADLKVGTDLEIYGRTFHIVDADLHTRQYYKNERKVVLSEQRPYPEDEYTKKLEKSREKSGSSDTQNDIRLFMEAALGKPMKEQLLKTRQFLKNDRKVLKFFAEWDDKSMYGEKRHGYRIHFFLADDTVEILEPIEANSGRDNFPALLSRQKLPKNLSAVSIGLSGGGDIAYYGARDLKVGQNVNIYGREFLLTGADEYTKQYYADEFGMSYAEFASFDTRVPPKAWAKAEPAPYNGYGTEEDSLGSCTSLVPKPPRKDYRKMLELDRKVLRFLAKFPNPAPEDVNRRFVVTFYLADDTVAIFEQNQRNSGFVSGKFLERSRLKNPATGTYFKTNDFVVGQGVSINSFKFELLESDEASKKFLAGVVDRRASVNFDDIQAKIIDKIGAKTDFRGVTPLFERYNVNKDQYIDKSEFVKIIDPFGWDLTEKEVSKIFSKFDGNNDGRIDLKEFLETMSSN